VNGVYEDEEIAHDLKRTVYAMLRDGIPPRQVVKETSALYGIPEECGRGNGRGAGVKNVNDSIVALNYGKSPEICLIIYPALNSSFFTHTRSPMEKIAIEIPKIASQRAISTTYLFTPDR